jgi:hypothetical protein
MTGQPGDKGPLLRSSGPQDERVRHLPEALRAKALAREPYSLFVAPRRLGLLMLPAAAALVFLAVRQGVLSAAIVVVVAAVLIGSTLDRRIDVDVDGLTFVALLPLRPRQRFPYSAFAPFEDTVSTANYGPARGKPRQRAKITDPAYGYRVAGLFRRDVLETTNFYGLSYTGPALSIEEYIASLDAYHPGADDYVGR